MTRVTRVESRSSRVKNFETRVKLEQTRVKLESIMTRLTRHISSQSRVKLTQVFDSSNKLWWPMAANGHFITLIWPQNGQSGHPAYGVT